MIQIDTLKTLEHNPRTVTDAALERLRKSLQRNPDFLEARPLIVSQDNVILGGNQRWRALQAAGYTEIPEEWIRRVDWTEAQAREFALTDNIQVGEWDVELLQAHWMDVDLDALGLELDVELEPDPGLTDPDDVPEPPDEPVTRPGDLWVMGEHRLLCGDSTVAGDVERVLQGDKPLLMVTDPPYGVEYDAGWRLKAGVNKPWQTPAEGKVQNDNRADWSEAWELFTGDVAYVWHADVYSLVVARSLQFCGIEVRALICWAKSQLVISRSHYHHMHEPCWYAVRKGAKAHWKGGRKKTTLWRFVRDQIRSDEKIFVNMDEPGTVHALSGDESTVWEIPKPMKSETGHSTQKPVECMARPIRNHDSPMVYEPFSGSGTTIIACEQLKRRCRAIEISPAYCDVAVRRWEQFTGKTAERVHPTGGTP